MATVTEHQRGDSARDPVAADALETGERDRLLYALENRFAPHLDAAAAQVRTAEQALADAADALARAEAAEADRPYRSDPLVFMRQGVEEEVDGLARKTTHKKVRASYRFLLDRAVDLAAGEVQGHRADLDDAERERTAGVDASRAAHERALADLDGARAMQTRVADAERAARQGLDILLEKLSTSPDAGS